MLAFVNRHIACLAMLVGVSVTGRVAEADTPWERYVRIPTPEAAAQVGEAKYSTASSQYRLEEDLGVLAHEVASGAPSAIRLAVRLYTQLKGSGDVSEYLAEFLGTSIRVNAPAYLDAMASADHCIGVSAMGDLFVDRDDARVLENQLRLAALEAVTDARLEGIRNRCVRQLKSSGVAAIRNER
jgi:hypothetical protein